jgi:hypothetical protein
MAQGLDCDFGDAKWHAKVLEDADSSDVGPIIFSLFCPACKFNETLYVLHEDIDSVVKEAPAVRRPKASGLQFDEQENERPSWNREGSYRHE